MKSWPKTSDKEFSKRVCRAFMWAYFLHIILTAGIMVFDATVGAEALQLFTASQPAYMLVFGAVIAKSGVENVFKGKTTGSVTTTDSTVDDSNG